MLSCIMHQSLPKGILVHVDITGSARDAVVPQIDVHAAGLAYLARG